ncbi:MAG: hypothetical protein PHN80_01220 [Hespellia sp.]|nr:hypothetical protein [Hespellia sp.]
MKCHYCNNEMPDNTRYCNFCGQEQPVPDGNTANQQDAANQSYTPNTRENKPKKKKNILLPLAIAVVVYFIARGVGQYVLAPSYTSGSNNSSSSTTADSASTDLASELEAELGKVKDSVTLLENESFTMTDDNGGTYQMHLYYNEDTIYTIKQTYTLSTEGFDEAGLASLQQASDETAATCANYDFITYTYTNENNVAKEVFTCKDLDNASNVATLSSSGLMDIGGTGASILSLKKTEENLISMGFAKDE